MSRKKILYVTALYDGGMGRHLTALLRHFSQKYEVLLASPQPSPLTGGNANDVFYCYLPLDGRGAFWGDGAALLRLMRLCRELQPDLIHAHGFKATILSLPVAAFCPSPLVVTVHNYLAYPEKSLLPNSFFNGMLRRFDHLINCYVTVSEALRRFLTNCGIAPERIKTIYNGVPGVLGSPYYLPAAAGYKKVPLWERSGAKDTVLHIGTAGRLVPQKGMDVFIRAAAQLISANPGEHLRFYIAGDGPERDNLEKLRDTLKLQDVLAFKGKILNMSAYLASLDIFTLASRSEGLSYSLLEAAAAQLPVVAAASGGIPEIISQGKTGLLVPPDNSMALAWALNRLINEPQTRIKLGTAALAEIKRRFTEEKMLAQTTALYREIIGVDEKREKGSIRLVK